MLEVLLEVGGLRYDADIGCRGGLESIKYKRKIKLIVGIRTKIDPHAFPFPFSPFSSSHSSSISSMRPDPPPPMTSRSFPTHASHSTGFSPRSRVPLPPLPARTPPNGGGIHVPFRMASSTRAWCRLRRMKERTTIAPETPRRRTKVAVCGGIP
jgi:hypothetical protein